MLGVPNLTKNKLRSHVQYPEAARAYYSQGTTYIFGIRGSFEKQPELVRQP
jgi:hypothetical protein